MKSFLYLRREHINLQADSGQGDSLCYFSSFPNPSPFLFFIRILGYSQPIAGERKKAMKNKGICSYVSSSIGVMTAYVKNKAEDRKEPESQFVWRPWPSWIFKSLCWKMTANVHKKQEEDDLAPAQSAFSHATGKSAYKYSFKECNLLVVQVVFWV